MKERIRLWLIKHGFITCNHRNVAQDFWTEKDGTDMCRTLCRDCGWSDIGHLTR